MIGMTFRRGVFLLLGGVIVLPYVLLATTFARMLKDPAAPRPAIVVLIVVTAVIACIPAVLRGTRALEIAAARSLLGVELPEPPPGIDLETRLRTALWFALHLIVGGLVALGLLIALPMALVFLMQRLGMTQGADFGLRLSPTGETLAGIGLLILVGVAMAGLGKLTALMAPVLLGPSTSERIARLEAQASELAERNRLARELHDSVGHALTVTTLQAAAAQRVLASDPEFARRALAAIECTGRAAMADLDHVLGLLRDETVSRTPRRTLDDLAELTANAVVTGDLSEVTPAVSREAYRIVQEGLTNAAKHAPGAPVSVKLDVEPKALSITISNPWHGADAEPGRGLTGVRERVALLGGRFRAGPEKGAWRVEVRLPR